MAGFVFVPSNGVCLSELEPVKLFLQKQLAIAPPDQEEQRLRLRTRIRITKRSSPVLFILSTPVAL